MDETIHIQVQQYDAIIARGYSAKQLKAMYPQIPTIDLAISGYDIIQTVTECEREYHPRKIALCGVFGKLYEATDVCRLLGIEIEIYSPDKYQDLEENVRRAVASGWRCDHRGIFFEYLREKIPYAVPYAQYGRGDHIPDLE